MSRIGVVVLAAGRSSRFAAGQASKLLAPVDGVPIVRRAVAAAIDAGVGEVIVITGDRSEEVAATLEGLRARIVREPRFADGMATSLRRGVSEARDADAVMIALADLPDVTPMAYRRIAARWQRAGAAIVVPRYADSSAPSHPTLFAAMLFGDLLALEGDVGARSVIARHASLVAEEPLEWPAPRDVDTLQDLDAYLNSLTSDRSR
jgi:molybdenum cofactor cytidylyltransferase